VSSGISHCGLQQWRVAAAGIDTALSLARQIACGLGE
jgi:hypothetical protein